MKFSFVESLLYDSNFKTVPFGFLAFHMHVVLLQVVIGPLQKLKVERVLGLTFGSFKSVT